jgi:predicted membrane metal-binding protein
MTLVGCVWGWAFLRYDALTVVISHLTADLFIFNWPRLASGDPGIQLSAALTILLPAFGLLRLLRRRSRGLAPSSGVVLENTPS